MHAVRCSSLGTGFRSCWDKQVCRWVSTVFMISFGLQGSLQSTFAQETIEITPDSACQNCTISYEHVATLGALEDPTSPWIVAWVACDRKGHYYVGPTYANGEIAVYGQDGRFLRILGREGEGPGELKGIQGIRVTGGDTLHVLSTGRYTVMLTTGEVISTTSIGVGFINMFQILEDGRLLIGDIIETPELMGIPVHIYGQDGRRVRSFGSSSTGPQGFQYSGGQRAVSYTRANRIWVNPYGQSRLELWDTAGVHVKSFVQNAPWLEPWSRAVPGAPFRVRPKARVIGVHEDSAGRLWVIGRLPERDWRPVEDTRAYELVYDSVVEVIDPASGKLLASKRFERADQLFYYFISEDLVFARRVMENGVPVIDIWRLTLLVNPERSVP